MVWSRGTSQLRHALPTLVLTALACAACKKEAPAPARDNPVGIAVRATDSTSDPAGASPRSNGRAEAERLVLSSGVHEAAWDLGKALRPAVVISTSKVAREPARGASRFGGTPDVPPGFVWPTYVPPRNEALEQMYQRMGDAGVGMPLPEMPDGKRSYPLRFLAQLNLGEVTRSVGDHEAARRLPGKGQLYFFYDPEHGGWGFDPKLRQGFRVLFYEAVADADLAPAKPPRPDRPGEEFKSCPVSFRRAFGLPSQGDSLFDKMGLERADEARLDRYEDLRRRLLGHDGDGARHHLLGHPDIIQNDMRIEAQLVDKGLFCGDESGYRDPKAKALEADAGAWNLLLQIDSDECTGWMWGDSGTLYFWIRDEDLEAKRFDRAWMILQCY